MRDSTRSDGRSAMASFSKYGVSSCCSQVSSTMANPSQNARVWTVPVKLMLQIYLILWSNTRQVYCCEGTSMTFLATVVQSGIFQSEETAQIEICQLLLNCLTCLNRIDPARFSNLYSQCGTRLLNFGILYARCDLFCCSPLDAPFYPTIARRLSSNCWQFRRTRSSWPSYPNMSSRRLRELCMP